MADGLGGKGNAYTKQVLVRFGDCDAAGIVFYPRYLEMCNSLVEDWCREELEFSFNEIIVHRGWGLPAVHIDIDFAAPSVFGEYLTARLAVVELGKTSLTLSISFCGADGAERVRAEIVLVLIDRSRHKAITLPEALRTRMLSFKTG